MAGSENQCFICKISTPLPQSNSLDYLLAIRLDVIFLLRKVLEVSDSLVSSFLERFPNLCNACNNLVSRCKEVDEQLQVWNLHWVECKARVNDAMKNASRVRMYSSEFTDVFTTNTGALGAIGIEEHSSAHNNTSPETHATANNYHVDNSVEHGDSGGHQPHDTQIGPNATHPETIHSNNLDNYSSNENLSRNNTMSTVSANEPVESNPAADKHDHAGELEPIQLENIHLEVDRREKPMEVNQRQIDKSQDQIMILSNQEPINSDQVPIRNSDIADNFVQELLTKNVGEHIQDRNPIPGVSKYKRKLRVLKRKSSALPKTVTRQQKPTKMKTNEHSNTCTVCNKSFSANCALLTHQKIHTEVKPFECKLCDRGFVQKNHLQRHIQSHLEEKPYKRQIRGNSFVRKEHFKRHLASHSSEQPFSCGICGTRFKCKQYLNGHKRMQHENPKYRTS